MSTRVGKGFSKDSRCRKREEKMLEVYAELAPSIGGDPERDKQAMIESVERAGYSQLTRPESKLRRFMRLWRSDDSRRYLYELWGVAVEDDPDPVSLAMRMLHEHVVQSDAKWGPPDRAVSLAATRQMIAVFIPNQTSKVLQASFSTRVERPAEFDTDQPMQARAILPAGEKIAKPTGPTGTAQEDDDVDDDEDGGE